MKRLKTLLSTTAAIAFIGVIISMIALNEKIDHPFFKALQEKLNQYSDEVRSEKLYLQFDKTLYQLGEAIWFKAYLRNSNSLTVEEISAVTYVELLNPKGTVLFKHNLLMNDGGAGGVFDLASTLPGGIYKVKAYTNWMKNEAAYFEKDISVQKVVLPKLNMKLEFKRKAYGPGDDVEASLTLEELDKSPLRNENFSFKVAVAGQQITTGKAFSDFEGKSTVRFQLPKDLKSNDGLLNIMIPYRGMQESISRSIPIVLGNIDLQFFPEGGDLVHGLNTKLAFKAINEFGKPADVAGEITNASGQTVAAFKSFHDGMGAFEFKPDGKEKYEVKITKPEGIKQTYEVPNIKHAGFVLNVKEQSKGALEIKMQKNSEAEIYVIAQHGERILFSNSYQFNTSRNISIATNEFPVGLTKITLFNHLKEPQCERLVFLNKDRQLNVSVKTDKDKYEPREKVRLEIEAKDALGNPVQGDFSVAVADDKLLTFADDKQANILASLLLESELKGTIEEPNFYFDKEEPKADEALDYVMMTNGWRRFDWKEVQEETRAIAVHPQEQPFFAGHILDGNLQPMQGVKLKIEHQSTEFQTDVNGYFRLSGIKNFPISLQIFDKDNQIQKRICYEFDNDIIHVLSNKAARLSGQIKGWSGYRQVILENEQGVKTIHYPQQKDRFTFNGMKPGIYNLTAISGQKQKIISDIYLHANEDLNLELDLEKIDPGAQPIAVKYKKKYENNTASNDVLKTLTADSNTNNNSDKTALANNSSRVSFESIQAESSGLALDQVLVVSYKVPLIDQDNTTSGSTVTAEQIRRLPYRDIGALVANVAGLSSADEGDDISVRGSRDGTTNYYIDGVRVTGKNMIPSSEISQIEVITGGIPAKWDSGPTRIKKKHPKASGKLAIDDQEYSLGEVVEDDNYAFSGGGIGIGGGGGFSRGSYYRARQVKTYEKVDAWPRFYDETCECLEGIKEKEDCANEKMMEYFAAQLKDVSKEGSYILELTVKKNGAIKFHYLRPSGYVYNTYNKIRQGVNLMPKMIPGKRGKKFVQTKMYIPFLFSDMNKKASEYTVTREFYAPKYDYKGEHDLGRSDFRSTLYWNPDVQLNEDGKAVLFFYNSDNISQFRVTLEGLSKAGQVAHVEHKFFTQKKFSIDTKLPTLAVSGDQLSIPITITNNTEASISGSFEHAIPAHFKLESQPDSVIEIAAKFSKTVFYDFTVQRKINTDKDFLNFKFTSGQHSDEVTQEIETKMFGFPINEVFSGAELQNTFELEISDPIDQSIEVNFQAHTSNLTEILGIAQRMIRQPNGCFEQTSSSNYPNLLAMQVINESGAQNQEIKERLTTFLDKGYKRLKGFEVITGGFDWYGRPPGHVSLTAYGLMQFVDMKEVYPVSEAMIKRTANWLDKKRDGKGGWKAESKKSYWGGAEKIRNAFILYALSEAGFADDLTLELDEAYASALKTRDQYEMALVANTLLNMEDNRADYLTDLLIGLQTEDGSWCGENGSFVRSSGKNLKVETTGLVMLALLKTDKPDKVKLNRGLRFLVASKNRYGFGSTQATVLALKAIIGYMKMDNKVKKDGSIKLYVGANLIAETTFKASDYAVIHIEDIEKYLTTGKNKITVLFEGVEHALPFEIESSYFRSNPELAGNKNCKVQLVTEMGNTTTSIGETVRLSTTLSNVTNDTLSNPMAIIGIPGGLGLQHWQLKEIQEQEKVAYYEIFDGKLALYFREIFPDELKEINLDLKADIPGTFDSPASSAYLYYDNESTFWVKPDRVLVAKEG